MSSHNESAVFTSFMLGSLAMPNRVVMSPLTRSRSNDAGIPPGFAAEYYAQRADAGLIITEATNISAQGRGYALTPGIWNDEQVEAWGGVTNAVHKRGGRIFLQLWHTGRISHPSLHNGALPVAPSAIKPTGQAFTNQGLQDHVTPRALETAEIPLIVEDYGHAAQCAKDAGFDGVEIHSANNYLLEQFIRDSTNHRTDEYGGSIENRLRFPLAVVNAVTKVWGDGQRVGIRISPATTMPGETPLDSDPMAVYGAYVSALSNAGLVYIHDIEGTTQLSRDPSGVDFLALRNHFAGAYIANNQYTLKLAEETLAAGKADLFSFGRPFIANPDLVHRLKIGAPLAEAPKEYWYGGTRTGYSDWPGMEGKIRIED